MQVKLYTIVLDWLVETFPQYSITADFSPYVNDDKIIGLGKVIEMDGHSICRITDEELIPWISKLRPGPFHATDPEFFNKIKDWIDNDIVNHIRLVKFIKCIGVKDE